MNYSTTEIAAEDITSRSPSYPSPPDTTTEPPKDTRITHPIIHRKPVKYYYWVIFLVIYVIVFIIFLWIYIRYSRANRLRTIRPGKRGSDIQTEEDEENENKERKEPKPSDPKDTKHEWSNRPDAKKMMQRHPDHWVDGSQDHPITSDQHQPKPSAKRQATQSIP